MSGQQSFKANEIIFQQGYPGTHAYIIQSGSVEIYNAQPDGTEEQIAVLKEGQMFGELAPLDDAVRSASARAMTDVELQIMPL